MHKTITTEQYNEINNRIVAFDAWVDTKRGKNGWASYKPEEIPAGLTTVINEERSSVEVYNFVHNPPLRYFLYIDENGAWEEFTRQDGTKYKFLRQTALGKGTTWTGEELGVVSFGEEFKSNLGDTRVSINFWGVNGWQYSGTYYKSAGNYARVRRVPINKTVCTPTDWRKVSQDAAKQTLTYDQVAIRLVTGCKAT